MCVCVVCMVRTSVHSELSFVIDMWTLQVQTFFFFLFHTHKCLPSSDVSSFNHTHTCTRTCTDGSVIGTSSNRAKQEWTLVPPFLFLTVLTYSRVSGHTWLSSWNLRVLKCVKGSDETAKGVINRNLQGEEEEINNSVKVICNLQRWLSASTAKICRITLWVQLLEWQTC